MEVSFYNFKTKTENRTDVFFFFFVRYVQINKKKKKNIASSVWSVCLPDLKDRKLPSNTFCMFNKLLYAVIFSVNSFVLWRLLKTVLGKHRKTTHVIHFCMWVCFTWLDEDTLSQNAIHNLHTSKFKELALLISFNNMT